MMTYDRKIIRMNETMWKQDIQALYDAAEKRANNATMVIRHAEMEGLQYDMS
jgi:hypothetical protein